MEVTYVIIVGLVTYFLGAITKIFINVIPNKYIPLQNIIIGITSGCICYFFKIESNFFNSIILCLMASTSAGGVAEVVKSNKNKEKSNDK